MKRQLLTAFLVESILNRDNVRRASFVGFLVLET